MTKIVDLRAKSPDELTDQLVQLKKEQFNLRFQRAQGQSESQGRARLIRRDIARIKTLQGGKSVAAAPVAAKAAKPKAAKPVAAKAAPKAEKPAAKVKTAAAEPKTKTASAGKKK